MFSPSSADITDCWRDCDIVMHQRGPAQTDEPDEELALHPARKDHPCEDAALADVIQTQGDGAVCHEL